MTELQGAEQIAGARFIHARVSAALAAANPAWKVYPGIAPRGAILPYVLYQGWPRPGGGMTTALGGGRVLARLRYLVKVQSDTLGEAGPLLLAIDKALQDAEGPEAVSGYYISNVDQVDTFEMPTLEGDEQYWQVGAYWDLTVSSGV